MYASLLDLMKETRAELADLAPRDNIDLHSFVFVVGDYKDSDAPVLDAS